MRKLIISLINLYQKNKKNTKKYRKKQYICVKIEKAKKELV